MAKRWAALAALIIAAPGLARAQGYDDGPSPYEAVFRSRAARPLYASSSAITRAETGTFMRPTYFTSINYPWIYGAYNYGLYEPGSWAASGEALPTPLTSRPTPGTLGPRPDRLPPSVSGVPESFWRKPTTAKLTSADIGPAAVIDIRLPSKAQVWIDGRPLEQAGPLRRIVTPPMQSRQSRSYEVRVRWVELFEEMLYERQVTVRSGDHKTLTFPEPEPETGKSMLKTDRP